MRLRRGMKSRDLQIFEATVEKGARKEDSDSEKEREARSFRGSGL